MTQIGVPSFYQNSSVNPEIILGDPKTGYSSDPIRTGFGKFNVHDHSRVSSSNPLLSRIQVGDEITGSVESCLENNQLVETSVFLDNTIVNQVTSSSIILSKPAILTLSNVSITLANTYTVPYVNTEANSNILTLSSRHGFITSKQLESLCEKIISGSLSRVTSGFYFVLPFVSQLLNLKSVSFRVGLGSAQVEVVSPQGVVMPKTFVDSSGFYYLIDNQNNYLVDGDFLEVRLRQVDSIVDLSWQLNYYIPVSI